MCARSLAVCVTHLLHVTLKTGIMRNQVLTEIKPFKNVKINKEMYGHLDAVSGGHIFLRKFGHFQMAVSCLLLGLFTPLQQTWGFCKAWSVHLGVISHSIPRIFFLNSSNFNFNASSFAS